MTSTAHSQEKGIFEFNECTEIPFDEDASVYKRFNSEVVLSLDSDTCSNYITGEINFVPDSINLLNGSMINYVFDSNDGSLVVIAYSDELRWRFYFFDSENILKVVMSFVDFKYEEVPSTIFYDYNRNTKNYKSQLVLVNSKIHNDLLFRKTPPFDFEVFTAYLKKVKKFKRTPKRIDKSILDDLIFKIVK
ncbi:MAG TPA: hypothetical protein P5514_05125 [Bacteroidales bacterium]|nr:hypothetical protein [Bacteroidales bacterium]HRX96305.1 hypothetical protein [Bacteroidales bacterium]